MDAQHLDAKLEAVEARTDAKITEIMGAINLMSANISNSAAKLGAELSEVKNNQHKAEMQMESVKAATASVKWNIVALGLTMGGLIIGIFAFGAQIFDTAQALSAAGLSAH